jgi:hypothetical protein
MSPELKSLMPGPKSDTNRHLFFVVHLTYAETKEKINGKKWKEVIVA